MTRQFASDSFAGQEEVAHYGTSDTVRTIDIAIPRNVTLDFLQSILQIPIAEGENIPAASSANNILNLDVGSLHFYTITQNKNIFEFDDTHPWILTCDDRSFVINSPKMQQSLDKLKPYMYAIQ